MHYMRCAQEEGEEEKEEIVLLLCSTERLPHRQALYYFREGRT